MGRKECDTCKKPFVDIEEWKKTCILCWKKEKGYELTKSDKQYKAMQDYLVEIEDELNEVKEALNEAVEEVENKPATTNGLTSDQIKALLRLCHPDKHSNGKLSNEVTKWLLALRDIVK